MNKKICFTALSLLCFTATNVSAHFGMVIPSTNVITQENRTAEINLSFSHPFEMIGMKLEKPANFSVIVDGKIDLTKTLKPAKVMDYDSWKTEFKFARPGVYQFVMEPQPYWEPAEDVSIIHYTKTIVAAYGAEQGWEKPAGLPAEIIPMLRPFGNYAGNSFVGQVIINGKPLAHSEVEVELYNEQKKFTSPSDYHITQVIRADEDGIFSFTCPQAGWWGFAALTEADYTLKDPAGNDKGVEIGAVLWTYMDEYKLAE